MPTALRFAGLRVAIYPSDHRPAHVFLTGAGREAAFNCMAVTDDMVREAEERFAAERRATPVAVAAHYDRGRGRVIVRLSTGLEIMFPPRVAEGLAGATAAQLGAIEISPSGLGLHFPHLDADLYVPALLAGVFGSPAWGGASKPASARPRKAAAE